MLRRIVALPNQTLIVLAVIALALSGLALHRSGQGTGVSTPPDVADVTTGGSTTTSSGPTTTGTGSSRGAPVSPATESVVAVDDRVAWRLTSGTCAAGGAHLAVTSDGGLHWKDLTSPVSRLVRVQPSSATSAFLIGGSDAGCDLGLRSTSDGGSTWSRAATIAQAWARDLRSASTIHVPGGGTKRPCGSAAVIDLARADASHASLLCADGAVRTSSDSGRTWPVAAHVPGALTVLATPGRTYTVSRSSSASCVGLSVLATASGGAASCVRLTDAPAPGTVGGSITSSTAWLRVGDRTFLSTDDLSTWHEAGA
jgi:hypothetical protein